MDQVFFQLLVLGALVTIVAHHFAVVAHNVHKVFSAFWHFLALRVRHGGVKTANGCSLTLGVGRLSAVLRCMALFRLFDPMVVGLSTSLGLVVWDIISPVALFALSLLGLKGFQLHRELLEFVLGIKQFLLFKHCLLHCQVKCEEKSVDPSGLQVRKHLLFKHIDPVN